MLKITPEVVSLNCTLDMCVVVWSNHVTIMCSLPTKLFCLANSNNSKNNNTNKKNNDNNINNYGNGKDINNDIDIHSDSN